MNPSSPVADAVGRTTQIIVAALMAGQVLLGVIAVIVRGEKPGEAELVSYLAAGFAALNVFISRVMPGNILAGSVRRLVEQRPSDWRSVLAPLYQTKVITESALLEGASVFNGIAYLIDGHWMSLAVMGGLVALMAMTFPSQMKFDIWAEQVQRDNS